MHTYTLTLIYFLLQAASFLIPRFLVAPSNGFVGAANAAVLFLGFQLVASNIAVYQSIHTYRARHKLTRPQVITGMAPIGITILVALLFYGDIQILVSTTQVLNRSHSCLLQCGKKHLQVTLPYSVKKLLCNETIKYKTYCPSLTVLSDVV